MSSKITPTVLSFSSALFLSLLRLYPKEYREQYEDELATTFGDYCRFAYEDGGLSSLLTEWSHTFLDMIMTAVEKRLSHLLGRTVNLATQWGGVAAIMGGLLSFFLGWSEDAEAYVKMNMLTIVVPVLFFSAQVGLYRRSGRRAAGQAGLWIAALGTAIWMMSWFMMTTGKPDGWNLLYWGWLLQCLGLISIGIDILRTNALGKWSFFVGLMGLAGIAPTLSYAFQGYSDFTLLLLNIFGAGYLVGWIALGFAMLTHNTQTHLQEETVTAPNYFVLSGWIAYIQAGIAIISFLSATLFFIFGGAFGPINDGASALSALALIPVAIALHMINAAAGQNFSGVATIIGILAMVSATVLQTLLVMGKVGFEESFGAVLMSFGVIGLWTLAAGLIGRAGGTLPNGMVWLMVIYGIGSALGMVGFWIGNIQNPLSVIGFIAVAITGPAWVIWFGRLLLSKQVLNHIVGGTV